MGGGENMVAVVSAGTPGARFGVHVTVGRLRRSPDGKLSVAYRDQEGGPRGT